MDSNLAHRGPPPPGPGLPLHKLLLEEPVVRMDLAASIGSTYTCKHTLYIKHVNTAQ